MSQRSSTTRGARPVLLGLLIVALLCAGAISCYASTQPDGLNKVAAEQGFDAGARDHDLDNSPLAGYSTAGVDNPRLSKGLAGVLGVGLTLLIGTGVFYLARGRSAGTRGAGSGPAAGNTRTDGDRSPPAR